MRPVRLPVALSVLAIFFALGCSGNRSGNPALKNTVKKALQQADLQNVTVDEDRGKNLITLGGTVHSAEAKTRAMDVAKSAAPSRVIANQISVQPVDQESAARKISGDVDSAIEKEYQAVLIANHLDKGIHYQAKNGVLTLTGKVDTSDDRQTAQQLASSVPNVQQVINELQVKRPSGL
ncbi:MAG TPA: BON domain-containing protein [Terriglobales bacterium]|nr:BON domain-containing protein [Terriglobales bacterium]